MIMISFFGSELQPAGSVQPGDGAQLGPEGHRGPLQRLAPQGGRHPREQTERCIALSCWAKLHSNNNVLDFLI